MYAQSPFCRYLAFATVIALAAASDGLLAQNAPRENKISLLLPDDTLVPLPLEFATTKSKVKLLGAGIKSFLEIPGKQTSVRLKSGDPQTFVMSLAAFGPGVSYERVIDENPAFQFAVLLKADADKKTDTRQIVLMEMTNHLLGLRVKWVDSRGIPLNFSRYDADSIRIDTRLPLPPGEYAFAAMIIPTDPYADRTQIPYYCFGVE
jgi:hypothetical protein